MPRPALAAGTALLMLCACQAGGEEGVPGASAAAFLVSASAVPAKPAIDVAPSPGADLFAIRTDRDLADLIAGCAGMNPQRRPRGSDCHGLFPEQCGADRVAPLVDQPLTADLRARIEAIRAPGGVRFIHPGEAVIQDLRPGRLNVELDSEGRIELADCY